MYSNSSNGMNDESTNDLVSRLSSQHADQLFSADNTPNKNGGNNWKEAFVASSSSQRRYLLPSTENDFIRISRINESESGTAEKPNFRQTLFNWTVNDSAAETRVNVANLKADLNMLCRDEDAKRKEHNHSRGNLQEAWDKLVQLRSHISQFKSAIEEATIEDVSLQATRGSWTSANLSFAAANKLPLTAESAIRLGDAHGIREKVRLKDSLQRKVALIEEFLSDLRTQLAHNSKELTRVNNTADRILVSDTISASMMIRKAVIAISKQLEDAESEYLALRNELEEVETELASILERARCNEKLNSPPAGSAASASDTNQAILGITTVSSEHLSNLVVAVMKGEDATKETALTKEYPKPRMLSEGDKPVRCEFSLHEVLSGYARVTRLNGEEPKSYRNRLEKRLFSLLVLDQQLQEELLMKTEDVRRARDQLREVEVMRLRVELQVTNVESNLRQLLAESAQSALVSPQTRPRPSPAVDIPLKRAAYPISQGSTPKSNNIARLFDNEFAQSHHGDYYTDSADIPDIRDIPGSMYSPRISPNHPNHQPSQTPFKEALTSSQSEEYLYSIAQLTAHSGVKIPGIRGETPVRRPSEGSLDGPAVERLQEAAKLLERDLASKSRGDTYIAHQPRGGMKKYQAAPRPPFSAAPSPVLAISSVERPAFSAKVAPLEFYDKCGRRLSASAPASIPRTATKAQSDSDVAEEGVLSPRRALERARSLLSQLESEREQSYTDSEGYSERNGGLESPPLWEGEDRGDYEGLVPSSQAPRRRAQDSPRGRGGSVYTETSSLRSASPKSRGRSRSPWDEKRMTNIPVPIRNYISPDKLRPDELSRDSNGQYSQRYPTSDSYSYSNETKASSAPSSVPALPCVPTPTELELQKLSQCQAKLVEVLKTEIVNHETGIAMDRAGNSLGVIDILVISARNLPVMKKLHNTADPFVEVDLVSAYTTALDAHAAISESQTLPRTSVQWNNLFPEWREKLKATPVADLSQLLMISVKDAAKVGENVPIGQCFVPLSKLLDQQSHTFWIPLEPALETRISARVRSKFPDNCAIRIEAKLTYCKRILLQQKFDTMLEKLKKMKIDGELELPAAVTKRSTAEIMDEAFRVRCAGGGRTNIEGVDGRRGGVVRDKRALSQPQEEERKALEGDRNPSPSKSSKSRIAHSKGKELVAAANKNAMGVYHINREPPPHSEPPKKPLKVLGVRERQDPQINASDLFRRSEDGQPNRFDSKLSDRVTESPAGSAASTLSIGEKENCQQRTIAKKVSSRSPSSVSEDKKEMLQITEGNLSSPDLSIFKSSRARLALKKSINNDKVNKCKPSSAFGTTCWTMPSPPGDTSR